MIILAKLYEKYSKQTLMKSILENVRPVVVAAIFTAGLSLLQLAIGSITMGLGSLDLFAILIFVLAFIVLNSKRVQVGPIILLVIGALVGMGYAVATGSL